MQLMSLECPNCKANIDVDSDRDFVYCQYCGTKIKFDDGVLRSEHTVSYRDEAKLRELELREEERVRQEKARKEEEERAARQRDKEAKSAARSLLFKILIAGIVFLLIWSPWSKNDGPAPTPVPVSQNWYKSSAVVPTKISLKEKTVTEVKGPLSYEIPKSWEIGETTVDVSHSEYFPKTFSKHAVSVSVNLIKISANTDKWDKNTMHSELDTKIRRLTSKYKLKELRPLVIGDREGVHAKAVIDSSIHPLEMFLVYAENYYCYVVYSGDNPDFDRHIDEVYFLLQSIKWAAHDQASSDVIQQGSSSGTTDAVEKLKAYPSCLSSREQKLAYILAVEAPAEIYNTSETKDYIGKAYYAEGTVKEYKTIEDKDTGISANVFSLSTTHGELAFADFYSFAVDVYNQAADNENLSLKEMLDEPKSDYSFPPVGERVKVYGIFLGMDSDLNTPYCVYGFPKYFLADADNTQNSNG